jgi:hypothetical protein
MHSAIFRTQVLRDSGVNCPSTRSTSTTSSSTCRCRASQTLYYLPVNLYRYFIGREDQSVNESVQISRLDQQMRVTDIMIEAHKLPEGAGNRHLAGYMEQYLGLIMAASSMFALLEGTENGLRMRREMWEHVDRVDPLLKGRLGLRQPLVLAANLPGPLGRATSLALYRLAQRIYKFS